jgi:AMP phosphorylase
VDIPVGISAKIKTASDAEDLASNFIELGRRFDMRIECAITEGSQPIGYNIGPILEAREALETLYGKSSHEILDKSTSLSGILFGMMGHENGKQMAYDLIRKKKSLVKMMELIEAQGGDPEVKPVDLEPGKYFYDVYSAEDGMVLWFNNRDIVKIARAAGTPNDKAAGMKLFAKLGDKIQKDKPIFRIYSESATKLDNAIKMTEDLYPIVIGKRVGEAMLKKHIGIPTVSSREFILER